ncbi:hypothetical protein KF913_23115 [Candidatus Obscuribacterales bacterium]|nr:hypothetical protein [Candidatus Obscuribacterales bacterium]
MEPGLFKFDFHATVNAVGHALIAVVCRMLFDFAMVGLGIAAIVATCAFVLGQKKHRFEKPLYSVAKRLSMVCAAISIPGWVHFLVAGHFPESGVYSWFILGDVVLWSMVTIYLCAEEMNHSWYDKGNTPKEIGEVEPENEVESSSKAFESAPQTAAKVATEKTLDENAPTIESVKEKSESSTKASEQVEAREHLSESVREPASR